MPSPLEERMAHLEGAYGQVSQRLAGMELRFDALDRKIDMRFDALDGKIDQRFMWAIGVVLGTWLTTIIAIFLHR